MTKQELEYWGPVLYMTTVTDKFGIPIGIAYPDGTYVECQASNVGKPAIENGAIIGVITWDGAAPDKSGGHTKGRLLANDDEPSYTVDSTILFQHTISASSLKATQESEGPSGDDPGETEGDSQEGE